MQIVMRKLSELMPYAHNPRDNAGAVNAVARSIREFGFRNPVIIDGDGVIVPGHTRVLAAKALGLEEIPCIVADDLTPEQIKAFRIADNRTAEIATWDYELLPVELKELQTDGFGLSLLGFDTTELESLLADTDGAAAGVLEPGSAFYIFHGAGESANFRRPVAGAGLEAHETLYWVKNALVLGRFDYQYRLDARRSAPLVQRQKPSSSTSRAATMCIPR